MALKDSLFTNGNNYRPRNFMTSRLSKQNGQSTISIRSTKNAESITVRK